MASSSSSIERQWTSWGRRRKTAQQCAVNKAKYNFNPVVLRAENPNTMKSCTAEQKNGFEEPRTTCPWGWTKRKKETRGHNIEKQVNSDIRRMTCGHKECRPGCKTPIDGTIDTFQQRSEISPPSLATHNITEKKTPPQKKYRQKSSNASHLTL